LFYAVLQNNVGVVRKLLDKQSRTESKLNTRLFENGIVEFGIPSEVTILMIAMSFASVEIVEMLLKKGADPYIEDKNGMDCLMLASALGRDVNVTFWLSRFPDWDVNRGNSLNGATALHVAVFVGRNKMSTMKALLKNNRASLNVVNDSGATILGNAASSEDSNVDIVQYLLSCSLQYDINHRRKSKTTKWKLICSLARGLVRMGIVKSGLMKELALISGATPLQWAVSRGDLEIVELLLQHGAEPSIENDLGRSVLSYVVFFVS
jgi:ankyrin repeat protein